MNFFLNYNRIYLIPIYLIIFYYIFPIVMVVIYKSGNINSQLLFLSLLAICTYYLTYRSIKMSFLSKFLSKIRKIEVNWEIWAWVIFCLYLSVVIYACVTVPEVPLFAAFKKTAVYKLSLLREQFLRTSTGYAKIPLYIYTICINSIIPLILTQMFLDKKPKRFILLFLFLFTLMLNLEKGRTLVALLPLIVFYVNEKKPMKAFSVGILLVSIILCMSFLSRGGLSNEPMDKSAVLQNKYNLFADNSSKLSKLSQAYFLINRVCYIPYMTAIDWLDYKKIKLNDNLVYGQSISLVSWITGKEKINLEREVFSYEWGQFETGTGSANTVYYIDAYLNFGIFGVLLYSILLAILIKIGIASQNKSIMATMTVTLYFICCNALPAMLFSGGLMFLLFIATFFRQKSGFVSQPNVLGSFSIFGGSTACSSA